MLLGTSHPCQTLGPACAPADRTSGSAKPDDAGLMTIGELAPTCRAPDDPPPDRRPPRAARRRAPRHAQARTTRARILARLAWLDSPPGGRSYRRAEKAAEPGPDVGREISMIVTQREIGPVGTACASRSPSGCCTSRVARSKSHRLSRTQSTASHSSVRLALAGTPSIDVLDPAGRVTCDAATQCGAYCPRPE